MSISPLPPSGLPANMAQPASISNFASTGVPGMTGGFAYPPGSSMTTFMDTINNTVSAATRGPNGVSVVGWANGLAAQAAQRKAQAAATAAATVGSATGTAAAGSSGAPNISQIFQMLLTMLASMKGAK
jgi:hypothetical protein